MNAIILAAGYGRRLRPLTDEIPKPLIRIGNEAIIERQIRFLKDTGVESIYIVTGYKHGHFKYLEKKYDDIYLLFNPGYHIMNNIYSLYMCKDLLNDTWILEGDVYLVNNFLKRCPHSTYFTALKPIVNYEWYFETNEQSRIVDIVVADINIEPEYKGTECHILSGISYWLHIDSKRIVEDLTKRFFTTKETQKNQHLYWDQIIYDNFKFMDIYTETTSSDDWFEIDTIEDLERLKHFLNNHGNL